MRENYHNDEYLKKVIENINRALAEAELNDNNLDERFEPEVDDFDEEKCDRCGRHLNGFVAFVCGSWLCKRCSDEMGKAYRGSSSKRVVVDIDENGRVDFCIDGIHSEGRILNREVN